jgi:hypothetical protein
MLNIALGIVCLAAAVALIMAFRSREGQPHPLMQRAGMDVFAPLVILSIAVAGVGLMVHGGFELFGTS